MKSLFIKFLQLCAIGVLIVIAYFLWPTSNSVEKLLPQSKLNPWELITLKSSNGSLVEIVAIHQASPEGLTFSLVPSAPLIGSNRLKKITTSWANINTKSMNPYRELYSAYKRALDGEKLPLQMGAHFYQIEDILRTIREVGPRVEVYYSDGSSSDYNFNAATRSTLSTRISRWSISNTEKIRVIKAWSESREKLELLSYRKDVILLLNRLDRGIKAVDSIQTKSRVFNITAAKNIHELVGQYDTY
jgi:hypothetical protein